MCSRRRSLTARLISLGQYREGGMHDHICTYIHTYMYVPSDVGEKIKKVEGKKEKKKRKKRKQGAREIAYFFFFFFFFFWGVVLIPAVPPPPKNLVMLLKLTVKSHPHQPTHRFATRTNSSLRLQVSLLALEKFGLYFCIYLYNTIIMITESLYKYMYFVLYRKTRNLLNSEF